MLKIQKIGRGEVGKVVYPEQEQGLQQELARQQGIEIERAGLDTGYYSEHGRAGARWLGSAWKGLGYSEDVSQEQLVGLILEHKTASGDQVHKIHGRTTVFGLEIDVSAPKSYSDLYAISEPAVQRKLMEIWNEVLADGVARMQRDYVRTRDGSGEQRHHMLTGGVAVRAHTHFTSREQDPQLHGHLLLPNMAQENETGRWKAIDTDFLYNNAKALGHWIQARLRDRTERELGVEWGQVRKGTAEIVGFPQEYLKATSQRSETIREKTLALAGQGIRADLHMRDEIAMESRRGKVLIDDLGEWQELQRARAAEFGLGAEETAALTPGPRAIEPSGVDLDRLADRLLGPAGATAMRNTFTPGDLIVALTDAGVKECELDGAMQRLLGDVRALELDSRLGATYTTEELVDAEREIITAFEQGVGQAADVTVPRETVDSVLAGASLELNAEQLEVLYAITASEDAFIAVEARAGVGKTTIADFAREAFEREGIFMLGSAPTGIAVRQMRAAGIANTHTLAKLRLHIADGGRLRELLPARTRRAVLFIDEAGMAHTREAAAVIRQARAEGFKIVAVGDSRQLKSVMAGGWLRHISKTFGGPELTQVMRQQDKRERAALNELAARKPDDYLQYQQQNGRIHQFALEDQDLAIRGAVEMLVDAAERDGYQETLLMTRENQRRQILNQHVQDIRRQRGQLGDMVLMGSSEEQELYAGDRVILKRNNTRLDVSNGTRGTILGLDPDGSLVIAVDDAGYELRALPGEYVAEHVRLGYASTVHGGQSATVNTAIVITQPNEVSANSGYTAFSRDRHATHIFLIADTKNDLTPVDQLKLALRRDDVEELAVEQLQEWEQGLELEPDLSRDHAVGPTVIVEPAQAEAIAADVGNEHGREPQPETAARISGQRDSERPAVSVQTETAQQRERERLVAAYNEAVSARRLGAQRELEVLCADLNTARQRLVRIRGEFDQVNQRARQVGKLADTLEKAFPTGYATAVPADRLSQYRVALENLAAGTRRRERKQRAEHAASVRSQLPRAARQLLNEENRQGVDDLEMLARYERSRAARDRLNPKREHLWHQAHDGDKARPAYKPTTMLIDEAGMTRINALEQQIHKAETTIGALEDPQQTINQRLATTLELNQHYRRPPASLQEANTWTREWGYGLRLDEHDGAIIARIPELPGWRHPLNQQQLHDLDTSMRHGQQLGQQLDNLGIEPRQAARVYQRETSADRGIGD